MNRDLFSKAGRALYGTHWQRDLGDELDVADRQLRRWIAGQATIPPGVALDILGLCDARLKELQTVRSLLEEDVQGSGSNSG